MTPHSGECLKCGVYREFLHRDHIVPKWSWKQLHGTLDGVEDDSNIQYLCANCHEDKTRQEERRPEYHTFISETNRGRKVSEQGRENMRRGQNRPEVKERKSRLTRATTSRPEAKEQQRRAQLVAQNRPEVKKKHSKNST